jgi:4a-hydroxytetrahydrobiopterin dehydratase
MAATPLSDIEIQRELGTLPGWVRRGNALSRSWEFADFPSAIAFVNRVADAAERLNHHPDVDIRYTRVSCHLSTHSAGGITRRDFTLAAAIDRAGASDQG